MLLACVIYGIIVFLPMIYEQFFEDKSKYEELGYFDVLLDFVLSSFGQAFSGLFNALASIFIQSV